MSNWRLSGGTVYDPANEIHGEVRDLFLSQGRVVATPPAADQERFQTIDCHGRVIMPGGVDMHSHIAGHKVNVARKMQPELSLVSAGRGGESQTDWRLSGNRTVPTIIDTGLKYLGLGYTTAFDAAIAPTAVRSTRAELRQLPYLDAGYFLLLGNHHFLLDAASRGDQAAATRFLDWILRRCGGYAPKLVNPGGVENFKRHREGNARDLDAPISGFETTPRRVIETLAEAAERLQLPHPVHIHCNNLGLPGNYQTTLETMQTLAGRRGHFAHIQFHSYGGSGENETAFCSRVQPLADYVNSHPEISIDVGQVLFGQTTSMTGDNALGYYLARLSGQRYYSCDTELESGCGISPIEYKAKNFVHAMQWAIGLEWFLSVRNPWQLALTTDHPNGASFLAYPQIIRLLMDSSYRRERLREVHPRVLENSALPDLDREYSLGEIAIITRAAPARLLGLSEKGHLGPGADADLTLYTPQADREQMFQFPWAVFKSGELVLRDGELLAPPLPAKLLTLSPRRHGESPGRHGEEANDFEAWVARHYSFRADQFGIAPPVVE
ncbi:MAG: formylmethanofuran dehydrogenase subunit A [Planctomycetota bacterium]